MWLETLQQESWRDPAVAHWRREARSLRDNKPEFGAPNPEFKKPQLT